MLKSIFRKSISNYPKGKQEIMMTVSYPGFVTDHLSIIFFVLMVVLPPAIFFDFLNCFFKLNFWITISPLLIFEIVLMSMSYKFFLKIPVISKLHNWLYFNLYTKKGNAITKQDFERMKNEFPALYKYIALQKAPGYCYPICHMLLDFLKKGKITFLAVEDFDSTWHKNTNYHMHVLYVNGDYAFDTDSCLQIPYDEYISINDVKIYKTFSLEDEEDLPDRMQNNKAHQELVSWCKENQVFLWNTCPVVE